MYTLVSAAVLAADLVRHPAGGEVADVLDAALRLGRPELAELSRAFRDDGARRQAWLEVETHAGMRTSVDAALGEVRHSLETGSSLAQAESELCRATFGGLGDLLSCLREEILGWTRHCVDDLVVQTDPLAVRAVGDALGAAYVRGALAPAARTRLRAPWIEVFGELPVVAPGEGFGPHSAEVRGLCERVARADRGDLERLHEAQRATFGGSNPATRRDWAPVMHRACQAAFVAGRVREAAAAQLAATRAALVAGVPPALAATGVMTALTGAVQAVVLGDVLDDDTFGQLVGPWEQAFGEL